MTRRHRVRPLSAILIANCFACAVLAQQAPSSETGAIPTPPDLIPSVQDRPLQTSPGLPRVSCNNNQLSISADNATLRSVLVALQACLGIKIEIPATLREERSYIRLGPGPARKVLQDLLGSTDLDYVLQPSDADPERINAILLMPHLSDNSLAKASSESQTPGGMTMSPAHRAWLEARDASRQGNPPPPPDEDVQPNEVSPAAPPPVERSASDSLSTAGVKKEEEGDSASEVREAAKTDAAPGADVKTNPASDPSVASGLTPATGPVDPPSAAIAPADGGTASPEGNALQKKITDMQQLFEERKKLNTNSGGTPGSTPPPS